MHSCVIEKIELHSAHNMETENNATQNKTSTHSSCYNDLAVRKILVLIKVGLKVETKNYAKKFSVNGGTQHAHLCDASQRLAKSSKFRGLRRLRVHRWHRTSVLYSPTLSIRNKHKIT